MDREIPKSEIRRRRLRTVIRYVVIVAVIIVIAAVIVFSMRKGVKDADLIFSDVGIGSIETSVGASGKVVPAFEEIINSPITTRIVEVYCNGGDSVMEGTPLLRLDLQSAETELGKLNDELRMKLLSLENTRLNISTQLSNLDMQVKIKEMAVNRLRAEVDNERRLDSLGSGTGDRVREAELAYNTGMLELEQLREKLVNERLVMQSDLESAKLELSIFRKNLAEQKRMLEDARIKAPRSATLTYINNEIGARVNQGERVAVVSDLSHFRVDADIADSYADRVKPGVPVNVRVGREMLSGKVASVTPLSRNGVISFAVTLDDDDHKRLRSGLKTDVYVMCDIREDIIRIRNGSYYKGPNNYDMFVVSDDDMLTRRKVRLGECNYEWVEVIDGLRPGERVVISDMNDYRNSNKLKLKR